MYISLIHLPLNLILILTCIASVSQTIEPESELTLGLGWRQAMHWAQGKGLSLQICPSHLASGCQGTQMTPGLHRDRGAP